MSRRKSGEPLFCGVWPRDRDGTSDSADGMLQGVALSFESGRVAAFGEAAMFKAQMSEEDDFGMNHPEAAQNAQFASNVLRWLTGVLPDD